MATVSSRRPQFWATGVLFTLMLVIPGALANVTCTSSATAKPYLQFCSNIDWDILGSPWSSIHELDNIAKQTYVTTLTTVTGCAGTVLSTKCTAAFRKYACAYHFPQCVLNGTTYELRQPCRDVCEHYCSTCNIGPCPCFDLDLPESGTCVTLKEYCPSCVGENRDATIATDGVCSSAAVKDGHCPWDQIDMPSAASYPYPGAALATFLSAVVLFIASAFAAPQ